MNVYDGAKVSINLSVRSCVQLAVNSWDLCIFQNLPEFIFLNSRAFWPHKDLSCFAEAASPTLIKVSSSKLVDGKLRTCKWGKVWTQEKCLSCERKRDSKSLFRTSIRQAILVCAVLCRQLLGRWCRAGRTTLWVAGETVLKILSYYVANFIHKGYSNFIIRGMFIE